MTGATEPGSAEDAGRPADDANAPALSDPGSKTQPAEGGRDEATDGGSEQPQSDEAGN